MPRTDLSTVKLDPAFQGRRTTADHVADSLRQAIEEGTLADGAVLSQAAIAQHFSISRVPVREAMRQLVAEGLVESQAHHVAVVRGLSLERLAEIYDNRAVLEGHLLERAVPSIPDTVVEELHSEELAMRSERRHVEWLKRNAAFHHAMNVYAGDTTGLELVARLRTQAERYVRMWSGGEGVHQPELAGEEHAEILRLVAARDAEGARHAVEKHIRGTGERLVAYGRSLVHSDD